MDALSALRAAIMSSGKVDIEGTTGDPDQVIVIDGVRYAASTPTAFIKRSGSTQTHYSLLAVWLQWTMRDKSVAEYLRVAKEYNVSTNFVLVVDKRALIEYLEGSGEGQGKIDQSKLTLAASAGASAGSAGAVFAEVFSLEASMRRELSFRTRSSVLSAPGKNLRDEVFKHFTDKAAKPAPGAAAAADASAAAAGKKRGRAPAAAAAVAPVRSISLADPTWRATPVIVVPASASSLLNLYNVAAFLQDGHFVNPAEARAAAGSAPKPVKLTVRRRDARGNACQYYVVDDVAGFEKHDWLKVVAVFAFGPEWQFKGWRWGREEGRPDISPSEVFEKSLGFHLMFDGDTPHENVSRWNVNILKVDRARRHLDAGVASRFWSLVDQDIFVRKPFLLPKGVSNVPAPPQGAAAQ